MIIPKLAFRNMLGAGTKTWLNAIVLSLAFVVIITAQGIYLGLDIEASHAMIAAEYGAGQYWVASYDPYDPFSFQDAHAAVPPPLQERIDGGQAAPILVLPGTLYPNGRIQTAMLKGIDPNQTILSIPTSALRPDGPEILGLIGARMARATGLKKGDVVTARWRDARGTFDARDITIVQVMSTLVQTVDEGQVWLPLQTLREMAGMPGQATIVVLSGASAGAGAAAPPVSVSGWNFHGLDDLLKDIKALVKGKTIGASIFYVILLLLAMLAIFDTQLLSIWRRRREIGTMIALGFRRGQVIALFTLEGALNGVFAALVGALYGIPLLLYLAAHGFSMGSSAADSFGLAISERLYPTYSAGLVLGTTALVFVLTTIVSFMPTRRIAKLKPTDALRGKMT